MIKDWKACMKEVSKALSRYDGYSTYAKLKTILSVPASELFENNPSCYATEILSEIEKQGISRRVAQDHIKHGISLGFLKQIVSSGGIFKFDSGSMKKIDETARIAISPLGRTLCASKKLEHECFQNFLVTCAILDNDFDMYGLFLKSVDEKVRDKVSLEEFSGQFRAILQERKKWLEQRLVIRSVRDQISGYVPWLNTQLSGQSIRYLSPTSIKHHFSMRKEWAKHLSHVDEKGALTNRGRDCVRLITTVKAKNSMFWLAPTPECAKKVGILLPETGYICSAWELFRPDMPESDPKEEMVQRIAKFMESAFETLRLRVFAQASLAAVIPYIYFEERRLNQRVDIHKTFETVIRQNKNKFHCLLTANPEECHYQLRTY